MCDMQNKWSDLVPEIINKNKWGNPEKDPVFNENGLEAKITCIACLKQIMFCDINIKTISPYLCCYRCGKVLEDIYGNEW